MDCCMHDDRQNEFQIVKCILIFFEISKMHFFAELTRWCEYCIVMRSAYVW